MKTYTLNISLSKSGISKYKKLNYQINKILNSKELREYLGDKCYKALQKIQGEKLTFEGGIEEMILSEYLLSNHLEIDYDKDIIYVYNDAKIDVANANSFFNETTKENYPAQLSLAKMVEYGVGIVGSFTPHQEVVENWGYDLNGHGDKGWYYKDANGKARWTKGYEGRLVFYSLVQYIKENVSAWITEYLIDNIRL